MCLYHRRFDPEDEKAWHSVTWTFTLCGRRGTYGIGLALVTRLVGAGPDLARRRASFAWQAWRGTYGTGLALVTRLVGAGPGLAPRLFCVAGVALGDICRVALGDMDLHFVCQAWHLRHWAGSGDALGRRWARFGAAPRLFCVPGVALGDICRVALTALRLVGAGLGSAPRLFCVAGVVLGHICRRFVWQAWHSVTWTFTFCGRRGTYGTGLALVTCLVGAGPGVAPRLFCVPGVALGDICRRFV
eukprot:s106_g19.t1